MFRRPRSDSGRVVLITGCSSGFGFHTALTFARRGWHVAATMRDLGKAYALRDAATAEDLALAIERIDVHDRASIDDAVARVEGRWQRLDVLVNNAGYGLVGAIEDTDIEQIRHQFETNVFGAVQMIQAAMPIFRKQGGGHIINVTSVAGLAGMALFGPYCASKYALEGLAEAMRFEAALHNVAISNVEPGHFTTEFNAGSLKLGARMRDRSSAYRPLVDHFDSQADAATYTSPQPVADRIVELAESRRPPFHSPMGAKVRPLLAVRRLLGTEATQRLMAILSGIPTRRSP